MMNVDMNENDQVGVNPAHNNNNNEGNNAGTSSTITSRVHPNENESSQQNNNLEEQVVKKKAKLNEETSAPTSASSATALRRKSSNDNEPLSSSKSFPNATNHNSFSSSSLTTSPRLGFGLPKDDYEQGDNNNKAAAAAASGYYSNSYDKDAELQYNNPNAETQLNNNNNCYLSSSSSNTGQLKDDKVYERALAIESGSNNNAATNDQLQLDNNNCYLSRNYFSVYKLPKKSSNNRKKKSNSKPKLDDTQAMSIIARDALSRTNNPNNQEMYNALMMAQQSMNTPLRCSNRPLISQSLSVYKLPKSNKNKDDENGTDNTSSLLPKDWTEEQKHKHEMNIIIRDILSLGRVIPQEKQDELMALHSNTLLNYNGQKPGGWGFAVGHTTPSTNGQYRTTTAVGICVKGKIFICHDSNNKLVLTGVIGTSTSFPIYELFDSTKLPDSDRSILDVIDSDLTANGLLMLYKAHSGQKGLLHQRRGKPLLAGLMITVSEEGIYPKNKLGPQEAWESWLETVKVYDEETRSSELLGFSASTPSLRNLVVLKKEHLGAIVDHFTRTRHALSADAQAMVVAVYNLLRVALREFARQRLLLGIEGTPSWQEVLPLITDTFTCTLVLSENAVTDSGILFIADTSGNLPEEIIGDLTSADKKKLMIKVNTGGFYMAVAPLSSHSLVKAQITALIVVLKKFGFGDESVSPETRRSTIMGIYDNVLRWKWAIKMVRMTNMFSQEVWYKISTNLNRDDRRAVLLEEDEDE